MSHTLRNQDVGMSHAFMRGSDRIKNGTAAVGGDFYAKGRVGRLGPILEYYIIRNVKLMYACYDYLIFILYDIAMAYELLLVVE